MHSWIVDLIMQYVAGLQPQDGHPVVVDPLRLGLEHFELEDAWNKGHRLDVRWAHGKGLSVTVDRKEAARAARIWGDWSCGSAPKPDTCSGRDATTFHQIRENQSSDYYHSLRA